MVACARTRDIESNDDALRERDDYIYDVNGPPTDDSKNT